MIFIRKHGNQIAEHMRRRRKAVQEQNRGSIPGTSFAIEDFQPVHVNCAIENGRRNRVRHLNPPSAREFPLRGRYAIPESSRTNADHCFSLDRLRRVEGRDGVVERSDVAAVCPSPTHAEPSTGTVCPARRRPCSNSPCQAVRPDITRAAPTVKSTSPGSGARLRASTATYSANVPSRTQSVRPNTRCPTDRPVVP